MLPKIKKDIIDLNTVVPKSDVAVFLDRDGVINEEVNLLSKSVDLRLIKGSAEAIKKLNELKIPVFLVSNQTVLARGLTTEKEFNNIHQKLISLLSKEKAFLDGVVYCLHSEKADQEVYRKKCSFRKPNTGMILEIEKRLNRKFPLKIIVGDQARDILMANKAKAVGIMVKTGHGGKDYIYSSTPDVFVASLEKAVDVVQNLIKNNQASAVILAGGKGTRLKCLTVNYKKELLEIGGTHLLSWQIQNLVRNGVMDIHITLCHNFKTVKDYLKDKHNGVNINLYTEKIPMGPAGALKELKDVLGEEFFVIYGDVLNNINLNSLLKFHLKNKALGTIVVRPTDHPKDSDLIIIDHNNKVDKVVPKPHKLKEGLGNTGIMIFNKQILKNLPNKEELDFIKDILPICLARNKLFAYPLIKGEYVKDIGTVERYNKACEDYNEGKITND